MPIAQSFINHLPSKKLLLETCYTTCWIVPGYSNIQLKIAPGNGSFDLFIWSDATVRKLPFASSGVRSIDEIYEGYWLLRYDFECKTDPIDNVVSQFQIEVAMFLRDNLQDAKNEPTPLTSTNIAFQFSVKNLDDAYLVGGGTGPKDYY